MHKTFSEYDAEELAMVGRSFVAEFAGYEAEFNNLRVDTRQWTECCLDWFARIARPDLRVDGSAPRPPRARGVAESPMLRKIAGAQRATKREFMFDLTHSSWMPDEPARASYWKESLSRRDKPQIFLALESEMGKEMGPDANVAMVMEDAAKLLHVVSNVKVMIFASSEVDKDRAEILELARLLKTADASADTAWLWLDLPWAQWRNDHRVAGWILHGKPDTQVL